MAYSGPFPARLTAIERPLRTLKMRPHPNIDLATVLAV
ncbi:hypothetical protein RB3546 [Rhodopirellula baltica SH 1]|uniref:Uncharacterized protein n=1 Tax=Rhodopirellula baltica (strain DSM 10527 / NCIMB 13988 / SH1) TaxID=243090 RepID=Q7UU32_RHOBA|nr:hypothetical protein RB3546 [Rhodopirellula baltica SH 1]